MKQDSMQVALPTAVDTTNLVRRRFPTPSPTLRALADGLLNQQIWCWGQDIRHPAGNLLLSYGFTRTRPPTSEPGSSHYQLCLNKRASVSIWGFGVFYGHADLGGLLLRRYAFRLTWTPQATIPTNVWAPEHLPCVAAPRTVLARLHAHRLLLAAVHWIVQYEHWIDETIGIEHRRRCLARFSAAITPAEGMTVAWRRVAQAYQGLSYRLRHIQAKLP